eukprot:gene34309-42308_t
MSAAMSWILKDGFGMIGSLTFAYLFAEHFEIYTKEWRLFADVLNNVGLTLDLVSSIVPRATKARISAHFARTGHLADVTVKESTQETAVALCGLLLGAVLTRCIGTDDTSTWIVFLVLLVVHQYSNYRLVKVLEFDTLNPQRCYLLVQETMSKNRQVGVTTASTTKKQAVVTSTLPSPKAIASLETFTLPFYLTYYGPQIGVSLQQFPRCSEGGSASGLDGETFDA